MLLDLLPLIRADLRTQVAKRLYASDASKSGGDVVYADLELGESVERFERLAETRIRKGWHSSLGPVNASARKEWEKDDEKAPTHVSIEFADAVRSCSFRTAISTRWKVGYHINILELEAVLLSVWHMLKSPATIAHRVHILIDSTVVAGAVAKGR